MTSTFDLLRTNGNRILKTTRFAGELGEAEGTTGSLKNLSAYNAEASSPPPAPRLKKHE